MQRPVGREHSQLNLGSMAWPESIFYIRWSRKEGGPGRGTAGSSFLVCLHAQLSPEKHGSY